MRLPVAMAVALALAACGRPSDLPQARPSDSDAAPRPTPPARPVASPSDLPTVQEYRSQAETIHCPEKEHEPPSKTEADFRAWWSSHAPLPHNCPAVAVVGSRELVVGYSAGGCIDFLRAELDQSDHDIVVTSVLADGTPAHERTADNGDVMYWGCTMELQVGVERHRLQNSAEGATIHRRVRLVPPDRSSSNGSERRASS